MDFGKILKNAWKTVWTHKVLFYFGFLMGIPSILMGIIMGGIFFFLTEDNIFAFVDHPERTPLFLILYFAFIIIFIIFSYVMTTLSFAGVFKGTLDLQGKKDSLSFSELWTATLPYFGRVLGVLFIIFLAIFILVMIPIFLGIFVGALTAGIGFLCLMPLFFLIIPLELVGYLLASVAMAATVAEDLGVFDALRRAWEVVKKKFWTLVLMTIILAFLQWAASMIVMIPMQFAQMALMFSSDFLNSTDPNTFFRPVSILILLFMPLIALVQSLGLTYANAAWMLTYLEVSAPETDEIIFDV